MCSRSSAACHPFSNIIEAAHAASKAAANFTSLVVEDGQSMSIAVTFVLALLGGAAPLSAAGDIAILAADAIAACAEISMLETDAPEDKSIQLLKRIIISMKKVNEIFARMPEKCDPYIYYHRVRPFIFGTKDNPDLKNGLIYKGEFESKPQFFRGETGAQSSIIPSLDGALQITHTKDHLRHYLNEMREYMPPKHREFMEVLEKNSQIKKIIKGSKKLTSLYNDCLEEIRAFRAMHLEYAGTYIFKQAQIKNPFGRGGSTITGTGGTPFMAYLKKHRDETEDQKK